jgi:hypothetical protein
MDDFVNYINKIPGNDRYRMLVNEIIGADWGYPCWFLG